MHVTGTFSLPYILLLLEAQTYYSDFFAYFTAEYRLLPNPKKACIFPILEIFSQSGDFIGIYSQIQKAQAVFQKRQ